MGRFLLSPVVSAGNGTGHIKRCIELAEQLDALILAEQNPRSEPVVEIPSERALSSEDLPRAGNWDFILLDRRATSLDEAEKLGRHGCLIGLDEGGPARSYLPYLIDALPIKKIRADKPNLSSLALLDLPKAGFRRHGELVYPFKKILISFGGEDPAGLTQSLLGSLKEEPFTFSNPRDVALDVVIGPAFQEDAGKAIDHIIATSRNLPPTRVLINPHNLRESLCRYDLVVTSFGITCFESLAAGVPVILFNPSRYHRHLSRQWNLPEIGIRRPAMKKLKSLLQNKSRFMELLKAFRKEFDVKLPGLSQWLTQLCRPGVASQCPGCGSDGNPVIARFPLRSYVRCSTCDLVYLLSFSAHKGSYNEDYYEEQYRQQYGRSYLEDFDNIKNVSHRRLAFVKKLLGNFDGRTLLDVGCAFGPFLQAAREEGLRVKGIDVSESCIRYVRDRLHIPAQRTRFEEFEDERVDVVTMWYVIEHFADLRAVLAKANRLLSQGGVFAFSTPNLRGVSGLKNQENFLEKSPADHRSVWSPAAARRLMKRYGFQVRRFRMTGHHPERFPGARKIEQGGLAWRLIGVLSRFFRLGDTFEVYATKGRDAYE
jgi:2-polyprenyl-3-methyl-5-hydroxy-6-metoxy-1,4-benzoquinol methylase/spore coat polysaccharide biosynthesis predicted glycosyltransferase SpsG